LIFEGAQPIVPPRGDFHIIGALPETDQDHA